MFSLLSFDAKLNRDALISDHKGVGPNQLTANIVLIASKAGTWELLINYFKQHYGNKHTAADNVKTPWD